MADPNGLLQSIQQRLEGQDHKLDQLSERLADIAQDVAVIKAQCPACRMDIKSLKTAVFGTDGRMENGLVGRMMKVEQVTNGIARRYWWAVSHLISSLIGVVSGLALAGITWWLGWRL